MKRINTIAVLAVALSLIAAPAVLAGGQAAAKSAAKAAAHHPWTGFNPGSWVKIKTTSVMGNQTTVMETKITLLEKTAEKVVLKTDMTINGQTSTTNADFPVKGYSDAVPEGVKVLNRGSETITVANRSLTCETLEVSLAEVGMKSVTKTWNSAQVPGGMARMVVTSEAGKSTVEVVDFKAS